MLTDARPPREGDNDALQLGERLSNEAIITDVETLGFNAEKAQVVEIGLSVLDGEEKEIAAFSSLVFADDAAIEAGKDALDANKIDPDQIRTAPRIELVAAAMWDFLRPIYSAYPGILIHSFNVPFDRRFLVRDPWMLLAEYWGECIMDASKKAMGTSKFPSLDRAIEHFGLKFEGDAHRALPDARMAAKVYSQINRARKAISA